MFTREWCSKLLPHENEDNRILEIILGDLKLFDQQDDESWCCGCESGGCLLLLSGRLMEKGRSTISILC